MPIHFPQHTGLIAHLTAGDPDVPTIRDIAPVAIDSGANSTPRRTAWNAMRDVTLDRRSWYATRVLLVVTAFHVLMPALLAQTLSIRLLNAKTGKALPNKNITFNWDGNSKPSIVRVGSNGKGQIKAPEHASSFTLLEGPKDGKEPNRVAYLDCNNPPIAQVSISEVLKIGFAPRNSCGSKVALPHPGEIIFWAREIPWWQPDFQ